MACSQNESWGWGTTRPREIYDDLGRETDGGSETPKAKYYILGRRPLLADIVLLILNLSLWGYNILGERKAQLLYAGGRKYHVGRECAWFGENY